MKLQLPLLFMALLLLTIASCNKDSVSSGPTYPVISGYTSTDNTGVPTNISTDPSDWTLNDKLGYYETPLFESLHSSIIYSADDSSIVMNPAFPNATTGQFSLAFQKPSDTYLHLRVVNKSFEQLIAADSISSSFIALNLNGLVDSSDDMVRVYYVFSRHDTSVYRGHGDIKLK